MQESFFLIESETVKKLMDEIQELKEMVKNFSTTSQFDRKQSNYLKRDEAAEYLNISPVTFDRYVKSGDIPYRHVGRRRFYQIIELDEWTLKHRKINLNRKFLDAKN